MAITKAESANDRLVTMAVIGLFGQDGPTGSAWLAGHGWLLQSGWSRGRGNEENFGHHRQADLKHG